MKIGTENRKELIAAIGLGVLAIVLLGRWIFSSTGTPRADAATPSIGVTAVAQPPKGKVQGSKKADMAPPSLDPTLRYDWLKISEDTKYEGTGRNIFQTQVEIPKPIASAVTQVVQPSGPPPLPPPPPINLKFYGFASKPGEPKKIFLSEGEDIFVASEGDIIDRRYKIVRISPTSVEVEDVLNNNRQSIPLTLG